ncbi:sensor histidine kinase [Parasediminibacterium sp. JCM 36343]|uniref:sensor histidine kinase n=1 Tax=Parasediminibacterium sp. JCM 36343 TaxID=3374279 RepID=UPI00397E9198
MQTISQDIKIVFAGTALLLCIFGFVFFFVIAYNRRYRKYEAEKADILKRFAMEKLQAQLEIREQTLKNISGEIHDNIGQILSLAGLQLSTIPTTEKERLDQGIDLIDKAIEDLRDISKSLDPDRVQAVGIIESIGHELNLLEKTGKYTTEFSAEADFIYLSADKTIILYRIVQETLNNIIKHAQANHINITVTGSEQENILAIHDNGCGFELSTDSKKGLGLKNITNRAAMIGGKAAITSILNKGTSIVLNIPRQ